MQQASNTRKIINDLQDRITILYDENVLLKEQLAAIEKKAENSLVSALAELGIMATDHPAYDESLETIKQMAEAGGDTCDWGIIALTTREAIADWRKALKGK